MHKTINKYFFYATAFIKEQSIFQPFQACLKTVDFHILKYYFLITIKISQKHNIFTEIKGANIYFLNSYLLELYILLDYHRKIVEAKYLFKCIYHHQSAISVRFTYNKQAMHM